MQLDVEDEKHARSWEWDFEKIREGNFIFHRNCEAIQHQHARKEAYAVMTNKGQERHQFRRNQPTTLTSRRNSTYM